MRIAIDIMGGDYAPEDTVKASVMACRQHGVEMVMVGHPEHIQRELAKHDISGCRLDIVPATEWLVEGEHPALALRTKRGASIFVATRLVKEGKADAVVAYGPTGGAVAAALQILGSVAGISRPVVGGAFLGFAPRLVMMDMGGNVDCRPEQLLDFAVVGTVMARKMLKIENPTVALLSNGAEEGKGNELVKSSWPLFKKSGLNFVGAAEGIDIVSGKANVIVCDGFVGNVLVKFCEGLGMSIGTWIEERLRGRLPESEIRGIVNHLSDATNSADRSGGGPIWAVNGVVVKGHGRSRAAEMVKGIGQAKLAVESDVLSALRSEIARVKEATRTVA